MSPNSHDYPEIQINSSQIFFSGSEDSPEKMEVISTTFSVDLNFDTIYADTFEDCQQDEDCSRHVPNFLRLANSMASEFFEDPTLTKSEQNEQSTTWLEQALYDQNYTSKYREVFKYYERSVSRMKEELA